MSDLEQLDAALDRYDKQLENVELTATTYEALRLIYESASAYRNYLADPMAAAANLDGAERVEWCVVHGQRALAVGDKWKGTCFHNFGCRSESRLVIPLPDKETP